ncbi:hypothetical protein KSS87_020155 [Heliosperma pusillum]|nr:hypothetical protein KSS87_020155 [Heliosperma pusillum]
MNSTFVKHISECFIKPKHVVEDSNRPYYLTPSDLTMLSFHYIQKGLIFTIPSHVNDQKYSIQTLLESLKESLSITLVQFYPLAGQLSTQTDQDRHECLVFVDCNKGPGAKFIHATLDLTVSDIISPRYVPQVMHALFDHDRVVNCDGHTLPLLSVQVTELLDGVFIGCSANHAIVDGTSYWQFWNTWSDIHTAKQDQTPGPLLNEKYRFLNGCGPKISLPFMHPGEIVSQYQAPQLKQRFFHFPSSLIMRLKSEANHDSKTNTISSFKALTAFVWKSIVKATSRPGNEVTRCRLAINNRPRLDPPLPNHCFGNWVNVLTTSTTVAELLNHDLGWIASQLHQLVVNYNNKTIRDELDQWLISPVFFRPDMLDSLGITMSSSPRFNMYGNEFGLGKPIAVRSGTTNKQPGSVIAYPGREGGGSVELEICLASESMSALESDEEFMAAASFSHTCI